jgi:hypothetical protein
MTSEYLLNLLSTVRIRDGLRKQSNLTGYDGETITQAVLQECLAQAEELLALASRKLTSTQERVGAQARSPGASAVVGCWLGFWAWGLR